MNTIEQQSGTSQRVNNASQEALRLKIMRVLETNPEASQREIARELGVSLGGVNYAMKALIGRGLVKATNFGRSDNKLGYVYMLTPAGVKQKAKLAARFLSRKLEEYEALRQEIEALRIEVGDSEGAGS